MKSVNIRIGNKDINLSIKTVVILIVLVLITGLGTYYAVVEYKLSRKADTVEKMIDDIGEITLDTGTKIAQIEEAYAALPVGAQSKVKNYPVYFDAKDKYIDILIDNFENTEYFGQIIDAVKTAMVRFDRNTEEQFVFEVDKNNHAVDIKFVVATSMEEQIINNPSSVKGLWGLITQDLAVAADEAYKIAFPHFLDVNIKIITEGVDGMVLYEIKNGEVVFDVMSLQEE